MTPSTREPLAAPAEPFDPRSGNLLERAIFNHRAAVLVLCALLTLVLGAALTRLGVNASFDKMLPRSHPYIQHYLEHRAELRGLGNTLRVVVEHTQGDIYDAAYLKRLAEINDAIFLMPGVDRPWMKSLWTPLVRWTEVTEEGFAGGPVMPEGFDGSAARMAALRSNVARAGILGSLVADDQRSSMIVVPLLAADPATGKPIDAGAFQRALQEKIRQPQEADGKLKLHVVGFVELAGELINALGRFVAFFAAAAAVAFAAIGLFTRCLRSSLAVIAVSCVAVVWQLGLMTLLGFALDPYSILVPFLVFAIGVSHGAQKMNGILQDVGRGASRQAAARYTFRRLFLAGLMALLANAVGFGVLMVIDIPVIRELALAASLGVAALVFTNLVMLPVILSYIGVSPRAAERSLQAEAAPLGQPWRWLEGFTQPRRALTAIAIAVVLAAGGLVVSRDLQIGDLDPGAPELRPGSRYNQSVAYIAQHYALSNDVFAVMVKTPANGCERFETQVQLDRLALQLQQVDGVQGTASLADLLRQYVAGNMEGSPKWASVVRNERISNSSLHIILASGTDLVNGTCSLMPVLAFLQDHKAGTLTRVVDAAEAWAAAHRSEGLQVMLAAGSAGVEAATNIVVKSANLQMLAVVYVAVGVLCLIAFRSWRATLVALLPLALTSVLAEALMVALGIGVKVATLPVIALGVGTGVDYALYLLSVQLAHQRSGATLAESYHRALRFTGRVVALVGITLAAGVVTWAGSPIKFQADMGIMLTFMFLWNMLGALVLIPALSWLLLEGTPPVAAAPLPADAAALAARPGPSAA